MRIIGVKELDEVIEKIAEETISKIIGECLALSKIYDLDAQELVKLIDEAILFYIGRLIWSFKSVKDNSLRIKVIKFQESLRKATEDSSMIQ